MNTKRKYTMQLVCTEAQWNKIQRAIRSITPQVSKQLRFHEKYADTIQAGLDAGLNPAQIHRGICNKLKSYNKKHNTCKHMPRYHQVYTSCKHLTNQL